MINLNKIRSNYPITQRDIFLNHAATSPVSHAVITRIKTLTDEMQRPLSEHFYNWLGIVEETRRMLADLINAQPTEIAFCQSTSMALNIIAHALPLRPGDKVIVPSNEFPSNIYVWQNLRQRGIEFEFFEVLPGVPVVETLRNINLHRVRLISISAVSFLTGRLYELKSIVDFCHERDIYICYDAIQAIGAIPFDVQHSGVDFVASGGQKWLLGSVGAGFFYVRKALLETLNVPYVGWTSVKYPEDFSLKELDLATDITRFEAGLPNILPIAGLNQSLRDLTAIGLEHIFTRIKENTTYLTTALNEQGINTLAQQDLCSGIVSFNIPPHLDLEYFNKYLLQHNIHITQRNDYIRLSPHFYNTEQDLQQLLAGLKIAYVKKLPTDRESKNIASVSVNQDKRILLIGANGILGKALARELAQQGFGITLVGRDQPQLAELAAGLQSAGSGHISYETVDFTAPEMFANFLARLRAAGIKYHALIHCAGVVHAAPFTALSKDDFNEMFRVNCLAAFQLMQLFINELAAENSWGILNIVSPTGRCGYPLLSAYAATNAALWTLTEAIAREEEKVPVMLFVAPAMHSRMQKRIGRVLLRYFKLSGTFDYAQPLAVAREILKILPKGKPLVISKKNRKMLLLNAICPGLINRRIRKIWKAENKK
ncbi:MAG TPA: aminotransferase class V-fold PLP-dependent enzyme [Gammaproteobacteria bacterium]|nr:aminotransferase class V-fold PLP-dependent enzyme [Gammaproteobacteria bacterium]